MKTTLYIVIWHEAIEASDLIAGIFKTREEADEHHGLLEHNSSGDYWEVIEKEVEL